MGQSLKTEFYRLLSKDQVFDLSDGGPAKG